MSKARVASSAGGTKKPPSPNPAPEAPATPEPDGERSVYGNLYGLFYASMDVKPRDTDEALRHALAAQRILRLMVVGMNAEEEALDGDDELLLELTWRCHDWVRTAHELWSRERAALAANQRTTKAVA